MQLTLSIPALLFPAISLTMLAYNARYLAIATLIRQLHASFKESPTDATEQQVGLLSKRLTLIKNMQAIAIFSFLLAVITMLLIYIELNVAANIVFGISLLALVISLSLSLIEVQHSTKALTLLLKNLKD